jgi:hypothetical protein
MSRQDAVLPSLTGLFAFPAAENPTEAMVEESLDCGGVHCPGGCAGARTGDVSEDLQRPATTALLLGPFT